MVRIPMHGSVASLNLSVACALLLFEAVRGDEIHVISGNVPSQTRFGHITSGAEGQIEPSTSGSDFPESAVSFAFSAASTQDSAVRRIRGGL